MKTNHTPGPWTTGWGTGLTGPRCSPTVYLDGRSRDIAKIPIACGIHAVAWVLKSGDKDAGMEADANLISAAPTLLRACHEALRLIKDTWVESHGNPAVGRAWGALERAIAKAEGGAE